MQVALRIPFQCINDPLHADLTAQHSQCLLPVIENPQMTIPTSSCNPGIGTLKTFVRSKSGKAKFYIGWLTNWIYLCYHTHTHKHMPTVWAGRNACQTLVTWPHQAPHEGRAFGTSRAPSPGAVPLPESWSYLSTNVLNDTNDLVQSQYTMTLTEILLKIVYKTSIGRYTNWIYLCYQPPPTTTNTQ